MIFLPTDEQDLVDGLIHRVSTDTNVEWLFQYHGTVQRAIAQCGEFVVGYITSESRAAVTCVRCIGTELS